MRLLRAETLQLEEYHGAATPRYAILSHTWEGEEVTFEELQIYHADKDGPQGRQVSSKAGFAKISNTCQQALRRGLHYAWVDTCCIDKSSSAELSEAINSMYDWYKRSYICLAYLSDVRIHGLAARHARWQPDLPLKRAFLESRWFTRGWTLQELLAPAYMELLSSSWDCLGSKDDLAEYISQSTGIDREVLVDEMRVEDVCIAQKMSWASKRKTTRIEDAAYSLMGLFGVNMPLLYGEGHKAFARLQEELARTTDDSSIFIWHRAIDPNKYLVSWDRNSLFAASPDNFRYCGDVVRDVLQPLPTFRLTKQELQIELPVLTRHQIPDTVRDFTDAVFPYRHKRSLADVVAVDISCGTILASKRWALAGPTRYIDRADLQKAKDTTIHLARAVSRRARENPDVPRHSIMAYYLETMPEWLLLNCVQRPCSWDARAAMILVEGHDVLEYARADVEFKVLFSDGTVSTLDLSFQTNSVYGHAVYVLRHGERGSGTIASRVLESVTQPVLVADRSVRIDFGESRVLTRGSFSPVVVIPVWITESIS